MTSVLIDGYLYSVPNWPSLVGHTVVVIVPTPGSQDEVGLIVTIKKWPKYSGNLQELNRFSSFIGSYNQRIAVSPAGMQSMLSNLLGGLRNIRVIVLEAQHF